VMLGDMVILVPVLVTLISESTVKVTVVVSVSSAASEMIGSKPIKKKIANKLKDKKEITICFIFLIKTTLQ